MSAIKWRFTPCLIEESLEALLPQPQPGDQRVALYEAMRYAVLGGGKRLRSQLVLEASAVVGAATAGEKSALSAACALEFIHAYSLVHDDLPAMDDADTRRGRPSCHIVFGEATAILAGDGLLTLAFETLAKTECPGEMSQNLVRAIGLIAQAAGEAGMVGGQAIDMVWSGKENAKIDGDALLQMHGMKTGALIRCATEVGALLGGGNELQIDRLRLYGIHLGRAFQITDDVLDVIGDPQQTGKAASDGANGKITAPAIFGLARAQDMAQEASDAAVAALDIFGAEADALRATAQYVAGREQ